MVGILEFKRSLGASMTLVWDIFSIGRGSVDFVLVVGVDGVMLSRAVDIRHPSMKSPQKD